MYLRRQSVHNVALLLFADTSPIRRRRLIPPGQTNWLCRTGRKQVFAAIHSLEVKIMKLVQSLVAIPALSFAQSNQPLTRADVRAQLVELERAGYNPAGDQAQYPKNIEAA